MASAMETAAEPPREFVKHTRACFRCKLVKTFEQVRLARRHPSSIPTIPRSDPPTHPHPTPPRPRDAQFVESGCDNCAFFNMADDRDRVAECTTTAYSGIAR